MHGERDRLSGARRQRRGLRVEGTEFRVQGFRFPVSSFELHWSLVICTRCRVSGCPFPAAPHARGAHSVLLGGITRLRVGLVRRWLALLRWRLFQTSSGSWCFTRNPGRICLRLLNVSVYSDSGDGETASVRESVDSRGERSSAASGLARLLTISTKSNPTNHS